MNGNMLIYGGHADLVEFHMITIRPARCRSYLP